MGFTEPLEGLVDLATSFTAVQLLATHRNYCCKLDQPSMAKQEMSGIESYNEVSPELLKISENLVQNAVTKKVVITMQLARYK